MELLVDCRENKIISKLDEKGETVMKYSAQQLQLGDFIIKRDEKVIVIFERKTLNDLYSSIIDGRYREQRTRLLEKKKDVSICYILEISPINSDYVTVITGDIVNLVYKHKINILPSFSVEHTIGILENMYKKLEENTLNLEINDSLPVFIENLQGKCKGKNILYNQLICIPGISGVIASKICLKYGNMYELINAYNKCIDEVEKKDLFFNFEINEKRKIGKKLSEKIYLALH